MAADADGDLEHGLRIMKLHEGKFSFDIWIRTKSGVNFKYNYPSGISVDTSKEDYLSAENMKDRKPGIHFNCFEGGFKSTDELAAAKV